MSPNFVNVEKNVFYADTLKCMKHNDRPAVVYLDVARKHRDQLVLGLCEWCVNVMYQALEPHLPQKDWVEQQHDEEYRDG